MVSYFRFIVVLLCSIYCSVSQSICQCCISVVFIILLFYPLFFCSFYCSLTFPIQHVIVFLSVPNLSSIINYQSVQLQSLCVVALLCASIVVFASQTFYLLFFACPPAFHRFQCVNLQSNSWNVVKIKKVFLHLAVVEKIFIWKESSKNNEAKERDCRGWNCSLSGLSADGAGGGHPLEYIRTKVGEGNTTDSAYFPKMSYISLKLHNILNYI